MSESNPVESKARVDQLRWRPSGFRSPRLRMSTSEVRITIVPGQNIWASSREANSVLVEDENDHLTLGNVNRVLCKSACTNPNILLRGNNH